MQVPFTNTKDRPVSIGGKRINPGETRSVEETMIPGFRREGAEAPPVSDPILELLDDSVKNIVPKLESLSDEDFSKVRQAEENGKTRKGLLEAFEEEALRRAEEAAKTEGGDESGEGNGGGDGEGSGAEDENGATDNGE